VYLLTGPSAAGKSTVGHLLAEQFDRGVHLEGDLFRRLIVSGRAEMTPSPSQEALQQLRLRYEIAAQVAEAYANQGFVVVLEDVIAGELLVEMVDRIAVRPVRVFVLMPSLEATAERERARPEQGYDQWTISSLYELFRDQTPRIGLWIDSSEQTPAETVAAVLKAATEDATPHG
jgi:chloramphenicol 3-O-phosphotransferase